MKDFDRFIIILFVMLIITDFIYLANVVILSYLAAKIVK
jgi:hypothetical protein